MTEPDVTLTDFAIALECAVFAVLLWRGRLRAKSFCAWLVLFFTSVSAASLCGGLVHGFFLDEQSQGAKILWPATLLAIGVTSFSAWAIGATLIFPRRVQRWFIAAAAGQFVIYSLVVLFRSQEFVVALVNNLPPMLFLLIVLLLAYRREKQRASLFAASGLALALVGGLGQQLGIGIHPIYFNHNALYHVVQAAALWMFFLGGRGLLVNASDQEAATAAGESFM